MNRTGIKMKPLYWLALFQLVAGPLMLVTVITFCKLTVREVPALGVAEAMSRAWESDEIKSLLMASDGRAPDAVLSSSSTVCTNPSSH